MTNEMQSKDAMTEILKQLAPQLYSDVAQPAAKEAGKLLANAISFLGVPFAAIGLLAKKANLCFDNNLKSYIKKLESIPIENRQEPLPQIAIPILQKVMYTTVEEIADLFNSLLIGASDSRQQQNIFPSFAEIVAQLSTDEAKIIKYLHNKEAIGYCVVTKIESGREKQDCLFILPNKVQLLFEDNLDLYLSDLERMGIIESSIFASSLNLPEFEEIPYVYDFEKIKQDGSVKSISNHSYDITSFGKAFIKACTYDPKEI